MILEKKDLIPVDCRFPYEFRAGKIKNAVNVWNQNLLEKLFPQNRPKVTSAALVFYCEFSEKRAPALAEQLKRSGPFGGINVNYPEIYVLEGGFSTIRTLCPDRCEGVHVSMTDKMFFEERKECHHIINEIKQRRRKCNCVDFTKMRLSE
ncbi:M-phase inducer phosphatase, putative [Entamoeba invadens IP1]|uniref:protein-tyrosine-phosphatase n=1 Tax=Entamoeba invadens IP1 TaxID=370355 RepID=L7FPJ5_ENTIV|nr:M-phase inducer phosphatase, putative [Entamoeba invadens IP1]ELP94684.1 M-phase inducer phosphatase, putative [Entamoeba invadens IP1]|eukprot:XP_004261455.1 M-phase inducer phosphatase, putative [Entamoeba invadens IP1]